MKPYKSIFKESGIDYEDIIGEIERIYDKYSWEDDSLSKDVAYYYKKLLDNLQLLRTDPNYEVRKDYLVKINNKSIAKTLLKHVNALLKIKEIGSYKKGGEEFLISKNNPKLLKVSPKQLKNNPNLQMTFKKLKADFKTHLPFNLSDEVYVPSIEERKVEFISKGYFIVADKVSDRKFVPTGYTVDDVLPIQIEKFEIPKIKDKIDYVRETLKDMNIPYTEEITHTVGELRMERDEASVKDVVVTLKISW